MAKKFESLERCYASNSDGVAGPSRVELDSVLLRDSDWAHVVDARLDWAEAFGGPPHVPHHAHCRTEIFHQSPTHIMLAQGGFICFANEKTW